jgi:hypothetical protein
MTPDQIQQLMNQQMQMAAAATPLWMKALFVLQVLSLLVTVVCLPLIVWKLFSSGKPGAGNTGSSADYARLQEIRDRREALKKLSGTAQPTAAPPGDDSRFRPSE